MKRALKKKEQVIALPKPPKPVKYCTRKDCGTVLKPNQKIFCSHKCRAMVRSPGNAGGGAKPVQYKPEYATTMFEAYMAIVDKKNEPTLIPTESSYIVIHNAELPTQEDFADFLGFDDKTLRNWAGVFPDFAAIMDKIVRLQKKYLLNNGLAGRYNAQIAKLGLNVNHGMVEKSQVDNTHKLIGVVKHVYARADALEAEDKEKQHG